MILFFLSELKQLSRIDRPGSRRSLIDTDNCRLATPFLALPPYDNLTTVDRLRPSWLCHRTTTRQLIGRILAANQLRQPSAGTILAAC
jgi:hypothetical protein